MKISYWKPATWALGPAACAGMIAALPVATSLAAESEGTPGLQEITVTAQRRAENLQDVPIAVTSVDGEEAGLRGTMTINSLGTTVPNLTVSTAGYNSGLYIRGVGSLNANVNNEPSAGVYVDGVYQPSPYALNAFALNNIERFEVLKGPQGTLFGRNTTAGVIQIITPDPQQEFGGKFGVGYGNYSAISANGYVTGGLSDNVAVDLAMTYDDQRDGWGHNLTYGGEVSTYDNVAARSKLLFTPSDATRINLAVDYANRRSDGINIQVAPGSIGEADISVYPGRYNYVGDPGQHSVKQYGGAVTLEHEFGSLTGKSISSYRRAFGHHLIDDDAVTLPAYIDSTSRSNYLTQELQLSNTNPGRLKWLIGAFYFDADVKATDPRLNGNRATAPIPTQKIYGEQKIESISPYVQGTVELVANTNLTLGLRYTDETLTKIGRQENLNVATLTYVALAPFNDEMSFTPTTYRAALDHKFAENFLAYVSFNHGFKSGGYNLTNLASAPFFPETLDAYEVGFKSEFMDNRVRLNVAAFFYQYDDLQVQISTGVGTSTIFTNAGGAENYGADIDLQFAATDNLTLSLGLGLLDAQYTDYPNALTFDFTGNRTVVPNAKGRDLPFAPPISGNVSISYRQPTSTAGQFVFIAGASYQGKSYLIPPQSEPFRPSYTLLNGAIEWRPPLFDDSLGIRVWGRNLTDQTYFRYMNASGGGWTQSEAEPRSYGLTLQKDF